MKFFKMIAIGLCCVLFGTTLAACAESAEKEDPQPTLRGLDFALDMLTLEVGEERETQLEFDPVGFVTEVRYVTSDAAVVTVGERGLVKAVAPGYAQITALAETKAASLVVCVNEKDEPDEPDKPIVEPDIKSLDGKGTKDEPFLIRDREDLEYFRDKVNEDEDLDGVYFEQKDDIALEGEWTPIGSLSAPFYGNYNGNGFKIENIHIDTDEAFQGLFGYIKGTVENVNIYGEVKVHMTTAYAHSYAGGLAGGMNDTAIVRNCKSYCDVQGDYAVGGLVGGMMYTDDMIYGPLAYPTIENCEFHGSVRGDNSTAQYEQASGFGGICGRSYGLIKDCSNFGAVETFVSGIEGRYSCDSVGGIVGNAYWSKRYRTPPQELTEALTLRNNKNYGRVYSEDGNGVGGVAGKSSVPVVGCENRGEVVGYSYVGGVVGIIGTTNNASMLISVVNDCTNYAEVTGLYIGVGGVVGYAHGAVEGCVNEGAVGGECDRAGGIVGGASESAVKDCVNRAPVTAESQAGGIIGYAKNTGAMTTSVEGCVNEQTGAVQAKNNIGGIMGFWESGNDELFDKSYILACANHAAVTCTEGGTGHSVGGIVGMMGSYRRIEDCENTGAVTGIGSSSGGVGGIAGSVYTKDHIIGCTNSGAVNGESRLGGIFGRGDRNTNTLVDTCENSGTVTSTLTEGNVYVGGIGGYMVGGAIKNCKSVTPVVVGDQVTSAGAILGGKGSPEPLEENNESY